MSYCMRNAFRVDQTRYGSKESRSCHKTGLYRSALITLHGTTISRRDIANMCVPIQRSAVFRYILGTKQARWAIKPQIKQSRNVSSNASARHKKPEEAASDTSRMVQNSHENALFGRCSQRTLTV